MTLHSSAELGLIATAARGLLRNASVASLATLESGSGDPYASLIIAATETDGSPVFLISTLAWHTRNLEADARASVLFAAAVGPDDPLNLGRVSVMGLAERTADPLSRRRFLARHPSAARYADFADFSFWRLRVERAHFVGGFGRITTLGAESLLLNAVASRNWDDGIDSILSLLNAEQSDLLARLSRLSGAGEQNCGQIAACDPDGCDLVLDGKSVRLTFAASLGAPPELPRALWELAGTL